MAQSDIGCFTIAGVELHGHVARQALLQRQGEQVLQKDLAPILLDLAVGNRLDGAARSSAYDCAAAASSYTGLITPTMGSRYDFMP